MSVDKITIANGAELSVIPTDKFKSNYVALNFYIPLSKASASRVSLLSRVMTRGTADHKTIGELNRYTDMLYELTFSMSVSAVGGVQTLCFRMDYLCDRFTPEAEKENITDRAMDFLKEFFLRPLIKDAAFLPEYVEAEKKLLIDRIHGEINNKDSYAARRAKRIFLSDHPAAISPIGDIDELANIDGTALYREYIKILNESHAEALFVGDVRDGAAEKLSLALRDILPTQRKNTPLPTTVRPDFSELYTSPKAVTEEVTAKQGRMIQCYALPYNTSESPVANVFIEIFSGSPISRLFMNVREKLNLCYYCAASADVAIGYMLIRSGIAEENTQAAKAEIERQLNDLVAGNISAEELETAKSSILSSLKGLRDSSSALGEWYLRRIALSDVPDIDAMMDRIRTVTVSDVAEFASRARLGLSYFLRGVSDEEETEDEE